MTTEEHGQGDDLVVVYHAQDEFMATVIKDILVGGDIPAVIESHQVAWMDGVFVNGEGVWGNVVVPEEYLERSRQLIEEYHANAEVTDDDVEINEDQPEP